MDWPGLDISKIQRAQQIQMHFPLDLLKAAGGTKQMNCG
jgi:hypothetical protein